MYDVPRVKNDEVIVGVGGGAIKPPPCGQTTKDAARGTRDKAQGTRHNSFRSQESRALK